MDEIQRAIDVAGTCVDAIRNLRRWAITIVDMGQEWLGRDAFNDSLQSLKGNYVTEDDSKIVCVLRDARLKEKGELGVHCCGVSAATGYETATGLSRQIISLLGKVPPEGFTNRSYVGSCADMIRGRQLDKNDLEQLKWQIESERAWAEKVGAAGAQSNETEDVGHSIDFRSLKWFGKEYSFTANQAQVLKMLYEHWNEGTPDVGDATLLESVDSAAPPERLNVLFRDHPAWNTLIVPGKTRGTHRLAKPA